MESGKACGRKWGPVTAETCLTAANTCLLYLLFVSAAGSGIDSIICGLQINCARTVAFS